MNVKLVKCVVLLIEVPLLVLKFFQVFLLLERQTLDFFRELMK